MEMVRKTLFVLALHVLPACAENNCVEHLLDALSHVDLLPDGMQNAGVADICGPTIDELGCGTNQFFELVGSYSTNLCVMGDMEDRVTRTRFKAAISLLDDYAPSNSVSVFSFCATNSEVPSVIKYCSLAFAKSAGVDEAVALYESDDVLHLSHPLRSAMCEGVSVAFESTGGSSSATNKMVMFGLKVLSERNSYWGQMDETLCCWWPAYATSSNRYVAAQRARAADPPCVSSNYLARVIAELEALPPGTMQMLSTNHLGQAWQE